MPDSAFLVYTYCIICRSFPYFTCPLILKPNMIFKSKPSFHTQRMYIFQHAFETFVLFFLLQFLFITSYITYSHSCCRITIFFTIIISYHFFIPFYFPPVNNTADTTRHIINIEQQKPSFIFSLIVKSYPNKNTIHHIIVIHIRAYPITYIQPLLFHIYRCTYYTS